MLVHCDGFDTFRFFRYDDNGNKRLLAEIVLSMTMTNDDYDEASKSLLRYKEHVRLCT